MEITKLTITPLFKGIKPFYEYRPSRELASCLIKDKLASFRNVEQPKILRKIPKALKGFVKPKFYI